MLYKKKEKFLIYKPLREIEHWEVNDDKVKLFFSHDKMVVRFIRWIIKKTNVSDLQLDQRGSTVWQLCDGTNTVYDIAKVMMEKFSETEQVSIDTISTFLRYMSGRGWITFDNKSK